MLTAHEVARLLGLKPRVIAQDRQPGRGVDGQRLRKGMPGWRPEVSAAEREHTPPELALWLVELARRCQVRPNDRVEPPRSGRLGRGVMGPVPKRENR